MKIAKNKSSSDTIMFSTDDARTVSPASSARSLVSASSSTERSILDSKCPMIFPTRTVTNDSVSKNEKFTWMGSDVIPDTYLTEVSEATVTTVNVVENEQIKSQKKYFYHEDFFENTSSARRFSISSALEPLDENFDETFKSYDYNKWASTSHDDFGMIYSSDNLINDNLNCYDTKNNNVQGSLYNNLFEVSDDILKIQEQLRENMMLQSTLQKLFP